MKTVLVAVTALVLAFASGCAVVKGRAGDTSYLGWAFGEKASSTLAGLAVVENQAMSNGVWVVYERSVGVDSAGSHSETQLTQVLGQIFIAGINAYTAKPASDKGE